MLLNIYPSFSGLVLFWLVFVEQKLERKINVIENYMYKIKVVFNIF